VLFVGHNGLRVIGFVSPFTRFIVDVRASVVFLSPYPRCLLCQNIVMQSSHFNVHICGELSVCTEDRDLNKLKLE